MVLLSNVPSPGLLSLEKNSEGRVVEAREENKVDNVTNAFVDLDRKV